MAYRAKHHVNYNGKLHQPDALIRFADGDEATIEQLLDAGAIEEFEDRPKPTTEGLAASTLAELKNIATVEGVAFEPKVNKADLVAAIEAKRAEGALAAGSGTQE